MTETEINPRVVVDHPSTASTSSKSGAAGEKRRSPDVADDPPSQPLSKSPRLQLQEVAVQTEVWQPTVARRRRSRPTSRGGIRFGKSEYVKRRATSEEPKSSQAADWTPKRRAKSEEKKKSAEEMEKGLDCNLLRCIRCSSEFPAMTVDENLFCCRMS